MCLGATVENYIYENNGTNFKRGPYRGEYVRDRDFTLICQYDDNWKWNWKQLSNTKTLALGPQDCRNWSMHNQEEFKFTGLINNTHLGKTLSAENVLIYMQLSSEFWQKK